MIQARRGGLRNPKGGRPPKPIEEKYLRRLITLPPATDDRLKKWSIETGGDISTLISGLANEFLDKYDALPKAP